MVKTIKFGDILSINREGRKKEKRYIFCGKVEGKLLLYLLDGTDYILVDAEWFRDKQMHYIEDMEQPEKGHNNRELARKYKEEYMTILFV
jgi:hypothetical protein